MTQLAGDGWLDVTDDPADRRARIVRRTPAGDDLVRAIRDLLAVVEERWSDEVSAERYAVFRSVLAELASSVP